MSNGVVPANGYLTLCPNAMKLPVYKIDTESDSYVHYRWVIVTAQYLIQGSLVTSDKFVPLDHLHCIYLFTIYNSEYCYFKPAWFTSDSN